MAPCKVVLLACGSYNPPTNMHLRMFEIARDHLNRLGQYLVVGGVISPVHDAYGKKELESSTHRLEMLRLALRTSDWIKLSDWECNQEAWSKTLQVLQHHQNNLNALLCDNNNRDARAESSCCATPWLPDDVKASNDPVTVKLLCGADLLESFSVPGLWKESDIETIVGQHGLVVITREGADPGKFVYESDQLTRHMRNILVVPEFICNEVSSTKVRRALRRQDSVRYLVPDPVLDYIMAHSLYGHHNHRLKYHEMKDLLNIPLNTFMLTPSPSDVNMLSVATSPASPASAEQDVTLSLTPFAHLDQPDAPKPAPKPAVVFKNDSEALFYPGQAVKVQPVHDAPGKPKKVGFADQCQKENPQKLVTAFKQAAEVQKIILEKSASNDEKSCKNSPKKVKKPPRFSDPTRSRNVFKRSNSDVPTSKSTNDLEATSVKIEFTREGVKVISDKESMV